MSTISTVKYDGGVWSMNDAQYKGIQQEKLLQSAFSRTMVQGGQEKEQIWSLCVKTWSLEQFCLEEWVKILLNSVQDLTANSNLLPSPKAFKTKQRVSLLYLLTNNEDLFLEQYKCCHSESRQIWKIVLHNFWMLLQGTVRFTQSVCLFRLYSNPQKSRRSLSETSPDLCRCLMLLDSYTPYWNWHKPD